MPDARLVRPLYLVTAVGPATARPMPIQSIEPRRLYRQIADQLRRLIDSGEFPAGSRLPPERDLAAQLGVSRPSVREALIALEVAGLVEVRMGSGIYVLQPGRASGAQAVPATDGPFEIIQARQLIEGELAAAAAASMDATQLAALREAVETMADEARRGLLPIHGDRLFHLRIAEASGNAVLLRLVTELFDERNNPLFARLGSHFENPDNWAQAIEEHAAVVEAIAARQPAEARRAMHEHLRRSQERFEAGWTQPATAA